jgi:hypothetical protein
MDDKVREELGTTRIRDGCVLYFGIDEACWVSRDIITGILTIHFPDDTEQTTAGGGGYTSLASFDASDLPQADPHAPGKLFIDATGHVAVSAG